MGKHQITRSEALEETIPENAEKRFISGVLSRREGEAIRIKSRENRVPKCLPLTSSSIILFSRDLESGPPSFVHVEVTGK